MRNQNLLAPCSSCCLLVLACTGYQRDGLTGVGSAETGGVAGAGGDDEADNESVQTEGLGEDENQDHTDEEAGLLSVGTDTGVTDNTDSESGSEGGHTDGQASTEVSESLVGGVLGGLVELLVDDDGGDKTVDSEDTGHDNGNDGLHHQLRSEDTHAHDTHTGLGGSVGGTEVREDDRGGDPHESEETGGRIAHDGVGHLDGGGLLTRLTKKL